MILVYGVRHSVAVFFTPILDEFRWRRGNISILCSVCIGLSGLTFWIAAPRKGAIAKRQLRGA